MGPLFRTQISGLWNAECSNVVMKPKNQTLAYQPLRVVTWIHGGKNS